MRPGDIAFDRFEIERMAGSGAMGTVYRARDRLGGDSVALKILSGREAIDAERFSREGAVLSALAHPGIVRYIAHGTQGTEHFLAMEWLDGEDLSTRLSREGLTFAESVRLIRHVAEALAVAHRRGVVHRDIKPSNLFLPGRDIDRVKLLDFGIARLTREGRGVTLTGAMLGTPGYMAPEQAQGARDLDTRADVFSLGCVLFKCVTGRAVYAGENVLAVLAKTILEEAPHASELRQGVPVVLDDFITRLLAKDPSKRPADAGAVALEIAGLEDLSVSHSAPTSAKTAALTASERRVVCVVLVGGASGMSEVAATLTMAHFSARESALRAAVESHGGKLDFLADGSILVTLASTSAATDQAVRAARCALEMRAVLPGVPMALATGGVLSSAHKGGEGTPPASDLIDRGVRLLARGSLDDGVWLDDATAGLLDVRFDVRGVAQGSGGESVLYLRGERDLVEATRTLLGKAYPCVGRDRELVFLESVFAECADEPIARAVLFTAPAGRGKSRVRYEFMERLKARGGRVEVLFGRGDSLSAGSPFGMIAPAIRRSAGILEGDAIEIKQKRLRARLARNLAGKSLARVTEFIGEMVSVPFPEEGSEALRAARRDAMLMGDGMLAAWLEWLEAECELQPVLLVLEDLHWGDLPTVRFVDAALGRLATLPFMVLALARPEVMTQFPGLWAEREVQEIKLAPLTPKASERLARDVLGQGVNEETLTRVVERSGGNAFYLEELIRAVAGGAESKLLPDSVLAMVQARLDAMGADAKRVLRAASIFGQIFWRGGVMALLGGEQRAQGVVEWLDDLLAREVIAPRGAARTFEGEVEYIFRHALLRDAAYAMLTDHDRSLGHKLAGIWLEQAGETDAMVLAEHFDRGGESWRAVAWYRRASEHALEGNDLSAAIARADRGIALCTVAAERRGSSPPPSTQPGKTVQTERRTNDVLGALFLVQAEAHKWRGELAEAERCCLEATKRLTPTSDLWFKGIGELISLSGQRGEAESVMRWVEEASAITMAREDLSAQLSCLCRGVAALLQMGTYEVADGLLAQIDKVTGDPSELEPLAAARVRQAWATRALQDGNLGRALTEFGATLEAFEQASDARNVALTRINFGVTFAELGEFERAEEALRQALAAADRMGLANVAAWAQNNLGNVLVRLGRRDEARAVLASALRAGEAQGNIRLVVSTRIYLSRLAAASGDLATAEREARTAADASLRLPPLRSPALAALARSLLVDVSDPKLATGHVVEAQACAGEALALLDTLGATEGDCLVRLVFAEALTAAGDRDAGRGAIAAARDRLLTRAAKLGDAALRESFLARVWENARTLELASAWIGPP